MLNPVFSRASRQGGSSLIEVLVAIIVLSVGMLSMLWAQTKSMGFERTAEFRNIAAQIASEYADRIRANLNVEKGVARADRANAYLYTAGYDPTANIPPYSGPDCLKGTVICTHYDIARFDQQEVRRQARNSLPGGDLLVVKNTSGDAIDIWVLWKQPNVPGLDDDSLSSDRFCPRNVQGNNNRPQCLQLGVKL